MGADTEGRLSRGAGGGDADGYGGLLPLGIGGTGLRDAVFGLEWREPCRGG